MNPFRNALEQFRRSIALLVVPGALLASMTAHATDYQVGPGRAYPGLQAVTALLKPGDTVTVDGGVTYPGGVTLSATGAPGKGVITVSGRRVNGARPILSGVTAQGMAILRVLGSHYVIEGFDLTAGGDERTGRCFYNVGDDVTLRDCVIHDCHLTGIAGSDSSGSLTLDAVEVFQCGQGLYAHQIYVGSSLAKYPNALFRMTHCYVHDGAGGNNVKSRVTRNEVEYNWIEGAAYHELDLVGPDPKAQKTPPDGVHCDADVIGNVLVKTGPSQGAVARLGSDGTGSSHGRYRFINNTIVIRAKEAAAGGVIWSRGEVEAIAMWNNVFATDAGPLKLLRQEATPPPELTGAGNWLPEGTRNAPPAWKAINGRDPGFIDATEEDYRPVAGSPLIGAGCVPPGIAVTSVPPVRGAPASSVAARPPARATDIGAFPYSEK